MVCNLGLPGLDASNSAVWGIPQIRNLPGLSGWGDDTNGPYVLQDAIFQWIDDFSWTVGKHSMKFGGEVRRDRYNQLGNEFARGAFSFSGIQTANPNTLTGGYGMAAYMLGAPSQVDGTVGLAFEQMRGISGAVYVDDTWRIRPTVTINMGLRYELIPPFYDKSQHETNLQMPFFASFAQVPDPNLYPVEVRSGTNNKLLSGLAVSVRQCAGSPRWPARQPLVSDRLQRLRTPCWHCVESFVYMDVSNGRRRLLRAR